MTTILTEDTIVSAAAPDTQLQMPQLPAGAEKKSSVSAKPVAKPPAKKNRRWFWTLLLAAMIGGGWHAWNTFQNQQEGQHTAAGESPAKADNGRSTGKASLGFAASKPTAEAAPVETVPAEVVDRSNILRLTGTLIADERSSVASNTSGIAAEVRVDRGSVVRKNDVLVQIDPTDAKNKLAESQAIIDEIKARLGIDENTENFNPEDEPEVKLAKASANLAAANFKRAKEMYAKKVISAEAYDQAETEYELANQRYRQALLMIKQVFQSCKTAQIKLAVQEKAVADTTIRAPFDGWVAEKLVAVGEQISSGMQATKVLTLVRIDPLRLSLTVPQQNIGSIKLGQSVRFQVDSFPDRTFEGKVRFIAPVVSNDTRSMLVEAVVPNPDAVLCPGLFATAQLELPSSTPQVLVPLSAVQQTGEVAKVFVVRDGIAHEQVVSLGEIAQGKVEIRSGLTGKEVLVAKPELIHDGDAVRL